MNTAIPRSSGSMADGLLGLDGTAVLDGMTEVINLPRRAIPVDEFDHVGGRLGHPVRERPPFGCHRIRGGQRPPALPLIAEWPQPRNALTVHAGMTSPNGHACARWRLRARHLGRLPVDVANNFSISTAARLFRPAFPDTIPEKSTATRIEQRRATKISARQPSSQTCTCRVGSKY